ncbi:hypothetical protein [Bradyrhizobium australiense]|uniref:Uncharacterized protein n=1 Tax=Bradyrhizobium australiense TaxID=2721161 RepID=A0A7Y4GV97_9BRAD|nr:hypothetical protein [Bradyrhizobium australiense]NOJ42546.1 hypothetical protein [Bradyrhizobium australiense]
MDYDAEPGEQDFAKSSERFPVQALQKTGDDGVSADEDDEPGDERGATVARKPFTGKSMK